MKKPVWKLATIFLLALSLALFCSATVLAKKGGGGPPGGEAAGNNLSYPVIWAEGVQKALRGTFGTVNLDGAWWYWWGTDLEGDPESCAPDPDDQLYCDDDVNGTVGPMPCNDGGDPDCRTVYLQQDALNEWQAESADWSTAPVNVDWIDWGDNLESVDWYTRSMVRTEVVLIQDLATPMTQYSMRHLYGWGQTEMHGVATTGDPPAAESFDGNQATVYSPCARLTIQKLLVPREELADGSLTWDSVSKSWTKTDPAGADLINGPIFNKPVYEGGDGPGYYSAEINVKGKVIYGYTWNVRRLHDDTPVPPDTSPNAAGDYRITFSFDAECGTDVLLNTFFVDGVTQILQPAEEVAALEEEGEEPGGGAVGVLVPYDQLTGAGNLTYMDVRILERGGRPDKVKTK
jgi:hypothetical protein